jgi:hypothetical protein
MANLNDIRLGALVTYAEPSVEHPEVGIIVCLNEHLQDPRVEAQVLWASNHLQWLYTDDEEFVVQTPEK